MLTKEKITEELKKIGKEPSEIFFYESTDSTNTRAREYAKEHPENRTPTVFVANAQTAGRGRRGRSFVSNEGAGIYISFLLYPEANAADSTVITARAAVALARATESASGAKPSIKWVNDLYLGGKKLAGILTEGETDENGNLRYIVCGMGINVYKNAVSEEISDIATSLESELSERICRSRLCAFIIDEFLKIATCDEREELYREYKNRSFVIGKAVKVIKISESYEAKAIDILPDYSLLLELSDGTRETLFTGEVSLKITE